MKKLILAAIAIAVCCGLASSAVAAPTTYTLLNAYQVEDGECVVYDPTTGYVGTQNVWSDGANDLRLQFHDPVTGVLKSELPLVDLAPENTQLYAAEALPSGNYLVRQARDTWIVEIDRTLGTTVASHFDPGDDPRGIAVLGANHIYVGDQNTDQVTEYDLAGTPLGLQWGHGDIGDNEGTGLSPMGTRVLVADDNNGRLVEFDLAGNHQGNIPMSDFVTDNIDPEGIASDPLTGRLFVSMDDGDQAWVVVLQDPRFIPEPAGLGVVGLALLAVRRRRS